MDSNGRRWPQQDRFLSGEGRGVLPQRTDVIENPERAAVGRDDQILIVESEIAHRRVRQIQLQRTPVIAVVQGKPYGLLGTRIQQPAAHRILAHRVGRGVLGQAGGNELPAPPSIPGPVNVRLEIIDTKAAHRSEGDLGIEMRCLQLRHLAPGRHPGRSHLLPVLAVVQGPPDQPVVGARPKQPLPDRRCAHRIDGAALLVCLRRPLVAHAWRHSRIVAAEIGADRVPRGAAVHGDVEPVRRVVEPVRILR